MAPVLRRSTYRPLTVCIEQHHLPLPRRRAFSAVHRHQLWHLRGPWAESGAGAGGEVTAAIRVKARVQTAEDLPRPLRQRCRGDLLPRRESVLQGREHEWKLSHTDVEAKCSQLWNQRATGFYELQLRCESDSGRDGERRRAPSLRLANGRPSAAPVGSAQSEEELKDDSIKISIENTNTCTDSLVTAIDDETLLIADFLSSSLSNMNKDPAANAGPGAAAGKVHFGGAGDDVSLYGTPKEEPGPNPLAASEKQSFLKNQLQAIFQPTDNKLAMKLFGSKKALMKERIRQKAAGHWVIHPCSSFSPQQNTPKDGHLRQLQSSRS
ncbi:uncharacterized protein LOC124799093 [Schistocerca piceifrons]|uniref:uncharacterized protein LOC124799093 n=1 Tax=Schistocerca piceifrons TaxID=274613 RepID=UPI001F5F4563|nr:uncharacterized protein LOC124799093 [Schistocerca piceifrons]